MHKTIKYAWKGVYAKPVADLMRAWMSTWLLSSGITGRWRLAYESESNSKRYLAILSGRTDNSWYLPYSPQSPCKIFSHLKAPYPILWVPLPERRWVITVLFIARIHIWVLMPETSSPSITSSGGVQCQWSALNGVLGQFWDHVVSMHLSHIQDRRHLFSL